MATLATHTPLHFCIPSDGFFHYISWFLFHQSGALVCIIPIVAPNGGSPCMFETGKEEKGNVVY